MAIDTREKRQAIAAIPIGPASVTPNATKDAEWRQEVGWSYPGIAAGAPTATYTHWTWPAGATLAGRTSFTLADRTRFTEG